MVNTDNTWGSIVLAGGGSAGHVNPLLAVATQLQIYRPDLAIRVVGCAGGLEEILVPEAGFPLDLVERVPFPRKPDAAAVTFVSRWRRAVKQAGQILDEHRAQAVIGFGGYASTPVYSAAAQRKIPIIVQEQNAKPGLANRRGARWAQAVSVVFPGTPLPKAQVTGLPMRASVVNGIRERQADPKGARVAAAQHFGLSPELPTLLVTGGSLGALRLNRALLEVLPELLTANFQVLHLTGRDKASEALEVQATLAAELRTRYVVREYLEEMALAYAVSDLVLCRSGAGTVYEVSANQLPAIYVPLPIGNGEQRFNAQAAVQAGAGLLVLDAEVDGPWLLRQVSELLGNPQRLAQMRQATQGLTQLDAARRVADLALATVKGPR